jgi:hypothetical protein
MPTKIQEAESKPESGPRQLLRGRHWPPYGHKLIFIIKNEYKDPKNGRQPGDHLGLQVLKNKTENVFIRIFKVAAKI